MYLLQIEFIFLFGITYLIIMICYLMIVQKGYRWILIRLIPLIHLYDPNIYIYIFSFQNKFLHSSKTWNTYFMSFSIVVDSTSQVLWQTVIYLHSLLRDHVNYWLHMQIQTNRSKDVNTYWPWRVNLVIH